MLCALLGLSSCIPEVSSAKTDATNTSAKATCRKLKDDALQDVSACHAMCPDSGANCAKTRCMVTRLKAWLEAEPTCKTLVGGYRPAYPPASLLVDEADDDEY